VQVALNQSVAQNFPDFSSALTVQKVIEACEVVGTLNHLNAKWWGP
jgi:hypothetical protein